MKRNRRAILCLTALAALSLLNGCHHKGSSHGIFHPAISFVEFEPNDHPLDANPVGFVAPVDRYVLRGHVDDFGFDLFDGFAFTADAPVEVEILLTSHNVFADLDVYVYDPLLDDFVVLFESDGDEFGTFNVFVAPTDFHLVVTSFFGSSGYTLEVTGFSPYAPLTAPGTAPVAASAAATSFAASGQSIGPLEIEPRPSTKPDPATRARRYFERARSAPGDPAGASRNLLRGTVVETTADGQVHVRQAARLGEQWVIGPRE